MSAPSALTLKTPSSSPGNDSTPELTVTVGETGGTVTLYSDSGCSTAASSAASVTDTTGTITVDITANAISSDSTVSYYATHTKSGVTSACSTATVSYTYDSTAPTVSTVVYSATDGGASVDDVIEGATLYTKIVFSEKVASVTADDATARPAIKAKAQRNSSDTITEFQYDIIASGDLASGDCKETGTGNDDGKVYSCMFTTPSTLTGYNTLKTYATAFADEAGNSGTAETYAGVTDVVGVKQTPSGVSVSFANADGSTLDQTGINPFNVNTQLYCANTCGSDDELAAVGVQCTGSIGNVWEARIGGQSGTAYNVVYSVTPFSGGTHIFNAQFINKKLPNGTVWYGIPANNMWYKDTNNDNRCTPMPETGATVTIAYKLAMTLTGTLSSDRDIYSISASDADSGTTTWKKKLLTSTQFCGSLTMGSGTSDYTEGETIEITSGTGNNSKRMCFKVTDDESTPRTEYKAQAISGLTKAALAATVGAVPSGSAESKNIELTGVTTGAGVKFNLITNAACNATNYGSGGTTVAMSGGAGTVTVSGTGNNNKYACMQVSKSGNTTRYFGSGQITGLTAVVPDAPSSLALGTGLDAVDTDSTPDIVVTVGATGGSVTLYTDSGCSTAGSSAANVTDTSSPYTVAVTANALTDGSSATYYAKHTKDGESSACSTANVSYAYDGTAPTISSATFEAGTTVTVVMSEDVWASAAPTASDFKVKSGASGSEANNVVTGITGLQSVKASADDSFDLTVTTALVSGNSVKVYYTAGTNKVSDEAGNELGSLAEGSAVVASEAVPTATLSGEPTGASSTTTLDVTVGGTGITHYKKMVGAGGVRVMRWAGIRRVRCLIITVSLILSAGRQARARTCTSCRTTGGRCRRTRTRERGLQRMTSRLPAGTTDRRVCSRTARICM